MFILASKHRAIVATYERAVADLQKAVAREFAMREVAEGSERRAREDYHSLSLRVAEFADRALPPPRVKDVKQPRSVDEADAGVAKKLRLQGKA